jgi:integrase/recombinase XerD
LRSGVAAKRVTPHSLRHTYAIRCLRSGGNVVAVAKLLGHSSIATTQRYVDHLAVSELRSTVPALPFLVDELAS